jgi:hypothetical protein
VVIALMEVNWLFLQYFEALKEIIHNKSKHSNKIEFEPHAVISYW